MFQRKHYLGLDALRGMAALMVVCYHIGEAFATSPLDQVVNHGYLAVDFFFLLSGFVVSYAYDERIRTIRVKDFFRRRLIRLHPMLLVGAILGGIMYFLQMKYQAFPPQSLITLLFAVLLNMLLIPASSSMDLRGNTEIFSLNGPTWSLFFEYIANILYVLFLRHLPTRLLTFLVVCSALAIGYEVFFHSPWAYLGAGWSFADGGFWGGLARVAFSFSTGMLLSRVFKPQQWSWGTPLATLVLVLVLVAPRLGGEFGGWINALYELVCVVVLFPLLLCLGASTPEPSGRLAVLYRWLGEISYPLYLVHYPFVYFYISWLHQDARSPIEMAGGAIMVFALSLLLAQVLLRIYDEPIRQKLSRYAVRRGH